MTRIVLLGSGEPHLFLLDAIRRGRLKGADVTLIAPVEPEVLGPMLAGVLAGRIRQRDAEPDLAALARAAGAHVRSTAVARLDAAARAIHLADGETVSWDLLSIATQPEPEAGPSQLARAVAARPASAALPLGAELERLTRESPAAVHVVVVGSGLRGIEAACAVRARLGAAKRGFGDVVTVVERESQLLPRFSAGAGRAVERVLVRQRIGVATGTGVVGGEGSNLRLDHGGSMRADLVIWAGNIEPAPLLGTSGLETNAAGFVITDVGLRSVSHPSVFAAGAAGAVREGLGADRRTRPARRDAAALVRALRAGMQGDLTSVHRPTRPVATFLDTSDGRALVFGQGLTVHSAAAFFLKERRDREILQRLRV